MKILLTHGYFLHEDPKEQEIMRPYPPLGILYVSAFLERNGIENEVFDTTFSEKAKLKAYLLEHRPPYLAMYVNLMTKLNVLEIIKWIKTQPALSDMKIILGGPDVRYNADNLLGTGADFLVIGEGEESALELVQHLESHPNQPPSEITGIGWKNSRGETVINPERTKVRNLNDLPFPNRKKIDLHKYLSTWKTYHGQSALSISTMRGCPYTCKWCSRGVYGLSYRRRSPESVIAELKEVMTTYQPDTLWFVDDVFTISHKWLRAFCDALKESGLKISYECISRADRMNEEVIQMLKESGCFRVWIGAESGSQKIIDLMDRRVDVDKVRDMIRLSRQYGIQAGTFIMLGYPGETEEDINETIHHLKVSNPDHFTITVAYPIKGTELFQEIEPLRLDSNSWSESTDRDIDFTRTYPRRYYDYAVRRVTNEVWYHQKVLNNELYTLPALRMKARSVAAKMGMWWERRKWTSQQKNGAT